MKGKRFRFVFVAFLVTFTGILFLNGCGQYEYVSPLPGIIDVRLHSKSNNLEFSPLNNFVLKVTAVEAVRDDYKRAQIFEDTKAIDRTTTNYNTLDVRARDSALVLGEAYLPPANYIGIDLLIEPASEVILDGYRNIPVELPEKFSPLLQFRIYPGYPIKELTTTTVVITIDLDKSLVKKANTYLFNPVYEISSIQ